MGWLDVFASEKIQNRAVDFVDSTVKGVGNWIDELGFTPEEKSKSNMELLAFRLDVLKKTADESSARAISRRFLAWTVTIFFLLVIGTAGIGFILSKEWAIEVLGIAKLVYSSFLAIISFYFISNLVDKVKK